MRCRAFWLLILACQLLALTQPRARAQDVAHLNLVLALDASASVNEREFALQTGGIAFALRDADVQAAIALAPGGINILIVQWASIRHQAVAVDWTRLRDERDSSRLADRVAAMPRKLSGGNTMIHAGVEFAGLALARAPAPARRQVIDVSGNGHADDVPGLEAMRDRFVADGIVINGLAIEEDPIDITRHYRRHLIGGPGAFVITAVSFQDFARAMRLKLLREIGAPIAAPDGSGAAAARRYAQPQSGSRG